MSGGFCIARWDRFFKREMGVPLGWPDRCIAAGQELPKPQGDLVSASGLRLKHDSPVTIASKVCQVEFSHTLRNLKKEPVFPRFGMSYWTMRQVPSLFRQAIPEPT